MIEQILSYLQVTPTVLGFMFSTMLVYMYNVYKHMNRLFRYKNLYIISLEIIKAMGNGLTTSEIEFLKDNFEITPYKILFFRNPAQCQIELEPYNKAVDVINTFYQGGQEGKYDVNKLIENHMRRKQIERDNEE